MAQAVRPRRTRRSATRYSRIRCEICARSSHGRRARMPGRARRRCAQASARGGWQRRTPCTSGRRRAPARAGPTRAGSGGTAAANRTGERHVRCTTGLVIGDAASRSSWRARCARATTRLLEQLEQSVNGRTLQMTPEAPGVRGRATRGDSNRALAIAFRANRGRARAERRHPRCMLAFPKVGVVGLGCVGNRRAGRLAPKG